MTLPAFVERLRAAGAFKRNAEPSAAEVHELMSRMIDRLTCPDCEGPLRLDEAAAWPVAKSCEACGTPIPPERLAIFPNATVCVNCQQAEESGRAAQADVDYCPRCGSPMTIRRTSSGVARYVMSCSNPWCRARA